MANTLAMKVMLIVAALALELAAGATSRTTSLLLTMLKRWRGAMPPEATINEGYLRFYSSSYSQYRTAVGLMGWRDA